MIVEQFTIDKGGGLQFFETCVRKFATCANNSFCSTAYHRILEASHEWYPRDISHGHGIDIGYRVSFDVTLQFIEEPGFQNANGSGNSLLR